MLGTIEGEKRARLFVSYLLTLKITTQVEAARNNADCWDVWVREEESLDAAKAEFIQFLANPDSEAYLKAQQEADKILRLQQQQRAEAARNVQAPSRNWRATDGVGSRRIPPLTLTLVILSVCVTLAAGFMSSNPSNEFQAEVRSQLKLANPMDYLNSDKDPLVNVKQFEVWRLFTPIFMHGDPFHLIFNCMCLVFLGRLIEQREGAYWLGITVLGIAIFSNLLQGCMPERLYGTVDFVGISGVVYGLFGYVWLKSTLSPHLMPQLSTMGIAIMLIWLVMGFLVPDLRIANLCHLGGLLAGFFFGFVGKNFSRKA